MKILGPKHTGYYHQKNEGCRFLWWFLCRRQSHPSPLRKAAPIFAPPPRRPGTEGFCHEFRKVDPKIGIHVYPKIQHKLPAMTYWVVVSRFFSFSSIFGEDEPILDSYFSNGLVQPPTSLALKAVFHPIHEIWTLDFVAFRKTLGGRHGGFHLPVF